MGKLIDLTGKRFGSLVVISYDHKGESGESYWLCKCDCGSVTVKGGHSLRRGHTTTCGEKSHNRNEYLVDGDIAYCVLTNSASKCGIDANDIDKIKEYSWHEDGGYAKAHTGGNAHLKMHRVIMDAPKGMFVDHINHNCLDNRKSNLRVVTPRQNSMNRKPKSEHHGVTWHKQINKWRAQISVDGKKTGLGCYADIEDAIEARKNAEIKYYGEYRFQPDQMRDTPWEVTENG